MHQHLEHLEILSAQFKFIVRGQRFQCHSRKTPREHQLSCRSDKRIRHQWQLIASSKYSSSRFSQDRPNWFPNSSLLTSAFCWVAQCRHLLDTLRSSSFRRFSSSFVVSRAIHQVRAVFLVALLSKGSQVTCFPMAWCCVENDSLRMPLPTSVH